jgi:hypothetical protein
MQETDRIQFNKGAGNQKMFVAKPKSSHSIYSAPSSDLLTFVFTKISSRHFAANVSQRSNHWKSFTLATLMKVTML